MIKARLIPVFAVAWVSLAAAAMASPATDSSLGTLIRQRLLRDGGVYADQVSISVDRGVAKLTGAVGTLLARQRAAALAETVPGVRGVVDLLSVSFGSRADPDIVSDIRGSLAADPALRGAHIIAYSVNGTATLAGTVPSRAERQLAVLSASGVPGVREINDDLVVSAAVGRPGDRVAADMKELLRWDAWLADRQIHVRVDRRRVTLTGFVGTSFERRRASDLAALTGAAGIDNRIEVRSALGRRNGLTTPQRPTAAAVRDVLAQDPRLGKPRPRIAISGDTIRLSGTVADFAARDAALADARTVSAGATVVDRMRVHPRAWPADALLRRTVLSALARDPNVPVDNLTVTVRHGRVTLRGVVAAEVGRRAAVRIAMRIRGVRSVRDEVTVLIQRSRASAREASRSARRSTVASAAYLTAPPVMPAMKRSRQRL